MCIIYVKPIKDEKKFIALIEKQLFFIESYEIE